MLKRKAPAGAGRPGPAGWNPTAPTPPAVHPPPATQSLDLLSARPAGAGSQSFSNPARPLKRGTMLHGLASRVQEPWESSGPALGRNTRLVPFQLFGVITVSSAFERSRKASA